MQSDEQVTDGEVLFKGLMKQPTIAGVPLPILFAVVFLTGLAFLAVGNFYVVLPAIPVLIGARIMFELDNDFLTQYLLKLKTNQGLGRTMRFFGTKTFTAQKYNRNSMTENRIETLGIKLSEQRSYAKFIPYSSHVAKNVVITRNGDLIATWRCKGISFETMEDFELSQKKEQLNILIQSLSKQGFALYQHNLRHKANETLNGEFNSDFAKEINDKYFSGFNGETLQRNVLYLTLVYTPHSKTEKLSRKVERAKDKEQELNYQLNQMQEMCSRINKALEDFQGEVLTTFEKGGALYSEQLSFYNYLITGRWQPVRVTSTPFYELLGNVDLHFGNETGQIHYNGQDRFFRCIEIKDFAEATCEGFFDALMYVDADYIITHSFQSIPNNTAEGKLIRQRNRLNSSNDSAISQVENLTIALDDLGSGRLSFGFYHFSMMIFGDSIQDVTEKTNEIIHIFEKLGLIVTLANTALTASYFGQFPANFAYRPRLAMLSSRNYASLTSLHNFATGKRDGNPWGDAVTILKTQNGQPYYFNFHESEIGVDTRGEKALANTLILGRAGSGKTMLMTFLMTQLQKFGHTSTFLPTSVKRELTTVYLDKDYGAEACIRAMGGKYMPIQKGIPTGFNPFTCENIPENLAFLSKLMKMLVTRNGKTLSSLDEDELYKAIQSVMDFDISDRSYPISRVIEHLPEGASKIEKENSLARRLKAWAKGGEFGWVFDNEADTLDFNGYPVFGIDGTEFLDDADTCSPIAFYLLERITKLLDGRRLAIFMDEFWKWLQDPAFEDFAYNKLKTIRKEDGFVVPATQSPDEVLKSPIARAVVEQCETIICLPNPSARKKDYVDGFGISEKQYEIVHSLLPNSRKFLIRKGLETTVAKLDLSALGRENLKILSTSKDNAAILHDILDEVGDIANDWIPIYKQRCV
ncbi:VirB4 family type IV secretion/conjugal transfer ATPase [Aggregatibacter actinomycetemcomitans]|uniref:VirB4 family type IV secretion/conjugal transfer ATPase n=1 Tax=Aggregatibacter actinomycetemcomitans TaxID=714 RepID=UPI00197BF826|nr:VirB4 family type IV secretion/conjugal transfer ATPase [Aggregatibacter actinomycetemcomitans]MBN6059388.1 VirB4 family type IV secretion/conjugal transfer ATPase [Aggregatibacter actinomycetemcomitans]MBN6087889.1 VirB4 family type IV secretion/conjugal transfer ATPase [Aggregatibacter actinomycetemcomitans]